MADAKIRDERENENEGGRGRFLDLTLIFKWLYDESTAFVMVKIVLSLLCNSQFSSGFDGESKMDWGNRVWTV